MKIKNLLIILSSLFLSFAAFAGGHKYSGPDLTGQKVVMFGPWLSPEQETMREVGAIFEKATGATFEYGGSCLLYTSPSPRDKSSSRMPSSA